MKAAVKAMWANPDHVENMRHMSRELMKTRPSRIGKIDAGHRTDIEAIVESELIARNILYEFEKHVDYYWIDFYLPEYHIALECDGAYWHREKWKDEKKDRYLLSKRGIRVIRLPGTAILADVTSLFESAVAPSLQT